MKSKLERTTFEPKKLVDRKSTPQYQRMLRRKERQKMADAGLVEQKHLDYLKSKRGPFSAMARRFKIDSWNKTRYNWTPYSFAYEVVDHDFHSRIQIWMDYKGDLEVDNIFHYITQMMRYAIIELDANISVDVRAVDKNSIFHTVYRSRCYIEMDLTTLYTLTDHNVDFHTVWQVAEPMLRKCFRYEIEHLPKPDEYATNFSETDLQNFLTEL